MSDFNIQDGDTLHLVLRLVGMISTFTSNDTNDPLIQYLMLTDEERAVSAVPIAELTSRAKFYHANPQSTFALNNQAEVLSHKHCQLLCAFVEFLWACEISEEDRTDLRASIPDDVLSKLIEGLNSEFAEDSKYRSDVVIERLHRLHPENSKITLRMTRGPTRACIKFHCDGGYATHTCQIALNDEYTGGHLCYFVDGQLSVTERPIGSVVSHPSRVLHGVTSLTQGVRKSLFVVDVNNGLGEGAVLSVLEKHVAMFLAAQVRPMEIAADDGGAKKRRADEVE